MAQSLEKDSCTLQLSINRIKQHFFLSFVQVPDSSQVTAVATQPPVAVWLTIYFQPSDSIKSLLRSSINTVSAARGSNSWVVLLTCPPADGQSICNDKLQQEVCFDWWKHCCYTPDAMDMPGSQCNVEPNRPMPSLLYSLLLYQLL